jgi:hypothetical protein
MRTWIQTAAIAVIGGALVNLLGACSFSPAQGLQTPADAYQLMNSTPYASITSSDRVTVVDDANRVKVQHGFSCAHAEQAASDSSLGIRVQESADLPPNYDGTVFLNGWKLEYSDGDHHVAGIGTTIFNVETIDNQLVWDAGGVISDDNGDDPYDWCYNYTLVFWPKSSRLFNMKSVFANRTGRLIFVDGGAASSTTSVHQIPGSFTTANLLPAANLLSGFGMAFDSGDHHILQVLFNLGPPQISGSTIGWTSATSLKDNAAKRNYHAAEVVTVLKGGNATVWQPPLVQRQKTNGQWVPYANAFPLTPRNQSPCPDAAIIPDEKVYHFQIPNVPFGWAVPMLTGWDLGDICTDHHVKKIGAWISDFDYARQPGAPTGTLTYTVHTTFRDDGSITGSMGSRENLAVSVLGINASRLVTVPPVGGGGGGTATALP